MIRPDPQHQVKLLRWYDGCYHDFRLISVGGEINKPIVWSYICNKCNQRRKIKERL